MDTLFRIIDQSGDEVALADCQIGLSTIPDITLFISCFNEKDTVVRTAERLRRIATEHGLDVELIFVDDCSSDSSQACIREYISSLRGQTRALLVERLKNCGLGANFRLAAVMATGRSFRLCCGDDPEPDEALSRIFAAFEHDTLILPYHERVDNKSASRLALSRTYTRLINLISGKSVRYYNGQAIVPRHMLLENMPTSTGFGFQAELISKALLGKPRFIEVPIETVQQGESTAVSVKNLLSVAHAIVLILLARMAAAYHRSRRREKTAVQPSPAAARRPRTIGRVGTGDAEQG